MSVFLQKFFVAAHRGVHPAASVETLAVQHFAVKVFTHTVQALEFIVEPVSGQLEPRRQLASLGIDDPQAAVTQRRRTGCRPEEQFPALKWREEKLFLRNSQQMAQALILLDSMFPRW